MPTTYLPRIAVVDHDTLRNLIHNYPANSYDDWLSFQAKEIADWKGRGWEVVLVSVSADDFTRYCGDTGAIADFRTLRRIASSKGSGKFH